jgi:hypothetical protein
MLHVLNVLVFTYCTNNIVTYTANRFAGNPISWSFAKTVFWSGCYRGYRVSLVRPKCRIQGHMVESPDSS